ncbi:XRE family transcriptional regulator [Methyloligella sp. 2.7D]|uniref:helix-turn-helix domain-containing protein n=1 Tax=unclassified Methyloligella TaxID=2625955 RepID=UPI00157D5D26|nr:XRE family transcriptional regulator [Methyloligella sp. GL2]QKP76221.1 helix-turn-helix transcriptional regulator [Methyloligella sp. GL2]
MAKTKSKAAKSKPAGTKPAVAKKRPLIEPGAPSRPEELSAESPINRRIGDVIRRHRKAHGLTLTQLAAGAGLSTANLSRIETGNVAASYESLERLSQAVGLTLGDLFAEVSAPRGRALLLHPEQQTEVTRSGSAHGHVYKLISYNRGPGRPYESFYITMDRESDVYPRFRHPGTEIIYMLRGAMDYRYGDEIYRLEAGDAFTFAAEIEHGPEKLHSDDIALLCTIIYDS